MSGQRASLDGIAGRFLNRHHGQRAPGRIHIDGIIVWNTVTMIVSQLVRRNVVKTGVFQAPAAVAVTPLKHTGVRVFHADPRAELTVGGANWRGSHVQRISIGGKTCHCRLVNVQAMFIRIEIVVGWLAAAPDVLRGARREGMVVVAVIAGCVGVIVSISVEFGLEKKEKSFLLLFEEIMPNLCIGD